MKHLIITFWLVYLSIILPWSGLHNFSTFLITPTIGNKFVFIQHLLQMIRCIITRLSIWREREREGRTGIVVVWHVLLFLQDLHFQSHYPVQCVAVSDDVHFSLESKQQGEATSNPTIRPFIAFPSLSIFFFSYVY